MEQTWDGQPVAALPPFGAAIVVSRWQSEALQVLVLHRAHQGENFEGEWAWTPPSGARRPGEAIAACARRELLEETGLALEPALVRGEDAEWWVYGVLLEEEQPIVLSAEHDRYRWLPPQEAMALCTPAVVAEGIRQATRIIKP